MHLSRPRSVAKISEGGHPRPGGELTFTSATQVNRFRSWSSLVLCKALVKAVSWSIHKYDMSLRTMCHVDPYVTIGHLGGVTKVCLLSLVEAF